eukprot:Opistho-2@71950
MPPCAGDVACSSEDAVAGVAGVAGTMFGRSDVRGSAPGGTDRMIVRRSADADVGSWRLPKYQCMFQNTVGCSAMRRAGDLRNSTPSPCPIRMSISFRNIAGLRYGHFPAGFTCGVSVAGETTPCHDSAGRNAESHRGQTVLKTERFTAHPISTSSSHTDVWHDEHTWRLSITTDPSENTSLIQVITGAFSSSFSDGCFSIFFSGGFSDDFSPPCCGTSASFPLVAPSDDFSVSDTTTAATDDRLRSSFDACAAITADAASRKDADLTARMESERRRATADSGVACESLDACCAIRRRTAGPACSPATAFTKRPVVTAFGAIPASPSILSTAFAWRDNPARAHASSRYRKIVSSAGIPAHSMRSSTPLENANAASGSALNGTYVENTKNHAL